MIYYKTNKWDTNIKEFEVVKATEKTVTYITSSGGENKDNWNTAYHNWHKSKQAAVEYLIKIRKTKIDYLSDQIKRSSKEIEQLEVMQK